MSPPPEPAPATGNMFTRRYGPLPGWAWLLITVAVVYLYMRYRASKTPTTQTSTGTGTGTSSALTSNLVGVQEPVPTLAGTYQVSVQPAQNQYSSTSANSTQGVVGSATVAPNTLAGTNTTAANANQTAQITTPQTSTSPTG